jgi:hypothetical protein
MAQAIDFSNLNSVLGAYYRDHKELLFTEMFYSDKWQERFNLIDGVTDEKPLVNMLVDFHILPGHDKTTWSPQNNAVAFGAQILKVRDCKVDLVIVPSELHKTWLGKYKKKGSDVFDLPFEQYIILSILKKIQEKMHLLAFYKGVYNAGGTTTADVMNGFNKLITDLIAATTITATATGAITSGNVISKLELLCDEIDPAYEDMGNWEMTVNPEIFNWYWKARRTAYGVGNLSDLYSGDMRKKDRLDIEGYNVTLVKEHGLGTSQRICLTPRENKLLGFDSETDLNNMLFQQFERTLKILIDFKFGAQFMLAKDGYLIVNDQS